MGQPILMALVPKELPKLVLTELLREGRMALLEVVQRALQGVHRKALQKA
jgi:hypothetical protein